jgi:isoaspartyl peptidase/L-asparaginase-like protein (Ntn-hydrolase superfamily)
MFSKDSEGVCTSRSLGDGEASETAMELMEEADKIMRAGAKLMEYAMSMQLDAVDEYMTPKRPVKKRAELKLEK